MAGVGPEMAVLVKQPRAIRRPGRAEVKMIAVSNHENAPGAVGVAGADLIALRTGEMERDATAIGTEFESVGQTFAGAREIPRVAAIQVHADQRAAFIAQHLDQHPVFTQQQHGGVVNAEPVARGDFLQRVPVKIVNPNPLRSLAKILLERTSWSIAPLFHTGENHPASVGKKHTRRP